MPPVSRATMPGMGGTATILATFVIKAEELGALDFLNPDHPLPLTVEWINRGTNQKLRRTSIDQLLRTLPQTDASPSVMRLQQSSGLRLEFSTGRARDAFATAFAAAVAQFNVSKKFLIASIFDEMSAAEQAVEELKSAGIPGEAISIACRAGQLRASKDAQGRGHTRLSVASAVAGGGVAGALFGAGLLTFVPGIGPIMAVGAFTGATLPSVTAVSAALGATGGAVARMLSDHDVDGRESSYFEKQIRRGRVFLSVDSRVTADLGDTARRVLQRCGGKAAAGGRI